MTAGSAAAEAVAALVAEARRPARGVAIEIGGQGIRFWSDDERGIEVARTILGPYCDITALGGPPDGRPQRAGGQHPPFPPRWTVTSARVDALPERIRALADLLARSGLTPLTVKRWPGDFDAARYDLPGGWSVVIHDRPFTGLTIFCPDECELHYLRADTAWDASHTEHVLKYPLRTTLRQAGLAQVHAAGCVFGGRGLLIMGEKASGKSTLLAHLMTTGADQVSNDLSFVAVAAPDGPRMIAFPHITRMGPGTVGDNAALRTGLAAELRTGDYLRSPVFNGGKEEFYFPVLERIWGRNPIARQAPLDAILFPALDLDCRAASARPVTAAERDERVRRALVTDPPLPDWLPFLPASGFRALAEAAADALLASDPPAYEVHYGSGASDPGRAIAQCLGIERLGIERLGIERLDIKRPDIAAGTGQPLEPTTTAAAGGGS